MSVFFTLLQRLLVVSMVTGAVLGDRCDVNDDLPTIESLRLSTNESTYTPGQTMKVSLSSTSGVTITVDKLVVAGVSKSASSSVIVGRFDSADGVQLACNGSTATQTNASLGTLQLTWTAPSTGGLGEVRFVANVVVNGSEFSVISDIIPVSEMTYTVSSVTLNSTIPYHSDVIVPEVTGDVIDTSSCGRAKLCMRDPAGCDGTTCDWLMTARDVGNAYDIELSATVTQTNAWVAFGLSYDEKMGYDSCVDCIHDAETNNIDIQLSWSGRGIDNHRVHGRGDLLNETFLSGSYVDGRITCRFRRFKDPLRHDDQSYPLHNDSLFFVLLSRGPSMGGEKYYHNRRTRTEHAFYFNDTIEVPLVEDPSRRLELVKAHGILMLFAWMVFASFAILMPRYCKPAWPGKTWFGKQIWFRIHQPCMLATFALTSLGFILVFAGVKRYSKLVAPTDGHPPCGIIVMILCFINPIMAFFRPEPGADHRPIFNWLHFIVGELAHIFAVITLFLAMYMVLPDLQQYVWCRAVMAAYICVHAAVEITLAVHKHRQTIKRLLHLDSGASDVQMDSIGTDAVPKDSNAAGNDNSGTTFITVVLAIHLVVVVVFALALSVQIGRS